MQELLSRKEALARYKMVTEALEVHAAQGTLDSQLAQRLRESQTYYSQAGVDNVADDSPSPEQPFTGRSSAARATSAKGGGNASPAALGYATSLWNQRQSDQLQTKNPIMYRAGLRMTEEGKIDPRTCSDLIDLLKALPWRSAAPTRRVPASEGLRDAMPEPQPIMEAGYYRLDGDFYRVKISKSSGRPYAEKRIDDSWDYESGKGVARKLTAANLLTAEDAKEFGDMYGECVFGGHPLTDQRSLDAGYGPKCAAKRGLPWG
jgi:hypothetical protein